MNRHRKTGVRAGERSAWQALRWGAAMCLAGWAWQHLMWSSPYAAVLWNPGYTDLIRQSFELSATAWTSEFATEERLHLAAQFTGYFLLTSAAAALVVSPGCTEKRKLSLSESVPQEAAGTNRLQAVVRLTARALLLTASGVLLFLFYCLYVESNHQPAILTEHTGQILAPVAVYSASRWGTRHPATTAVALIAFCLTFIGHGVFATGLAPTPGQFYGLVHALLGLNAERTELFLRIAGILDFLVCVGILFPCLRTVCLSWAVLWGLATAVARPLAAMNETAAWFGADQFLHEAVLRAPHVTMPLYLLVLHCINKGTGPCDPRKKRDPAANSRAPSPRVIHADTPA